MLHSKGTAKSKVGSNANALLAFDYDNQDDEEGGWGGRGGKGGRGGRGGRGGKKEVQPREQKNVIKDSEGINFDYYFSDQYNFVAERRRKKEEVQNKTGRGGRGDRGGMRGDRGGMRGERGGMRGVRGGMRGARGRGNAGPNQ